MKFGCLILALSLLLCGCGAYTPDGALTGNTQLDEQTAAVLEEVCVKNGSVEDNVRLVYDWVANEIRYRASTTELTDGFTEEATQELALELLSKRRGDCDGEAALMAVLLRRMGCEALVVEGTFVREAGETPVEHAWVIARVGEEYCHFDPLYGRYYAEDRMGSYCMATDELMEKTHQWDHAAYPACS